MSRCEAGIALLHSAASCARGDAEKTAAGDKCLSLDLLQTEHCLQI